MKKTLFFTILLAGVLTFAFSLCASAQTIIYDTYEEKSILTYDPSELVVFDDGCAYPSYYIFENSEEFKTSYAWLNEKATKNYSDANVVELCIPTGIINGGYFKKDSSFTSILKLNTGKTLQKTNGDFWTNLTLTHVTFGEGFTNSGLGQWFFNSAKVEYIIFSDNSQITTLPSQFFAALKTLKGIYFGNSITNLGSGTFTNMGSSDVFLMNTPSDTEPSEIYYFKSNLIEGNFYNFKQNATTTTWVFPSAVNGIGSGFNFDMQNNPKNFVFLTSDADSVVINDAIGGTKLNNVNMYFPYISSENASKMNVVPKTAYFFGDSKKASYNGSWGEPTDMLDQEHIYDKTKDLNTEPTCTTAGTSNTYCFCGKLLSSNPIEELGHDYSLKSNGQSPDVVSWVYENNNYFSNAKQQHKCLDCEAFYTGEQISDSALFVSFGYSTPEYESNSIFYSIRVNHKNIESYESIAKVTVRYGTVAATGSAVGTPISITNGAIEPMQQSVACEMTGTNYVNLTIKFLNVPKSTPVNCCAFAVIESTVTYLCDGICSSVAETKQL